MRKYLAVIAVAALVAFAAPAFAATNPFMDVPLNHWAYDAIGQLAAQGILSGYPDGTYKGKQPTTRYEMASALARALAVVDMTKASKQDVEMLKRLVIEFKDELDALGVKVDQLDERVALLESRLGGWKLTGRLTMDLHDYDNDHDDERGGDLRRSYARMIFQRWFGEDESLYFRFDLRHERVGGGYAPHFRRFFAAFPIWGDITMTVGRFDWDFESAYRFQVGGNFDWAQEAYLTDNHKDAIGFSKNFGLGGFRMYFARTAEVGALGISRDPWEVTAVANLQFTEQFGLDLGFQAYLGDDYTVNSDNSLKLKSAFTYFGGLRFKFNENIGLKGIYYGQSINLDGSTDAGATWDGVDFDEGSAFKAILDVKQDLLGFTSLWLEYNKVNEGFFIPNGLQHTLFLSENSGDTPARAWGGSPFGVAPWDFSIFRIGATQNWNAKWMTWLYFAHHTLTDATVNNNGRLADVKGNQFGLGVQYRLNPNITFGLSYVKSNWDDEVLQGVADSRSSMWDTHKIQFRTNISF